MTSKVFACILLAASILMAQIQVEALNRGLIAVNNGGDAYLSWRLLALEDWTSGFNVYRSVDGGAYTKLNSAAITTTTDFVDASVDVTKTNSYYVTAVVGGVEQKPSEVFTLAANVPSRQYFPIALHAIEGKAFTDYTVVHVYVGDVDGDGDFDYIVKRVPNDAKYNYILLECYDNNGVFKWRINLGPNVETYINTMTAPVLVADFDSDGKAEIIAKTGEGTTFGDGSQIGDTDKDGKTDYNTHEGSGDKANIFSGPEFISLIDGETGAEIDRDNFIARGATSDWGDSYGARVNFIMASTGYFDGVHPGAVFSRGPGDHMVVEAWQVQNSQLVQIWKYSSVGKTYAVGGWTDFHQIQTIDVDGDGKDEVSWGACMLDHNGTLLYTTKYTHGDRFQIADINPKRNGLEVFVIQQKNSSLIGSALYDAKTGTTIKDWLISAVADIGRGDAADVDPNSAGMEMFDTGNPNLHAADGTEASTGSHPYPWLSIWWDGDLLRENLIGVGNGGYNPAISKWNYEKKTEDRMFSIYGDGGSYVVTQPYGGRVPFVGDILGDWREEVILETSDRTTLRVYTTNIPSQARVYTLMQNPAYRTGASNKGYQCTKYTDYFLGAGMSVPAKPKIVPVSAKPQAFVFANDGIRDNSWTTLANWTPGRIPSAIDTAVIQTGEAQLSSSVNTIVRVPQNGVFRVIGNLTVPNVALEGGTLKIATSATEYGLTSNLSVNVASSIYAGSTDASVFNSKMVLTGSGNLSKTGVGILDLQVSSPTFGGNWLVTSGVVRLSARHATGAGEIAVAPGASLVVNSASGMGRVAKLSLQSSATVKASLVLQANDTVNYLMLGDSSVPAGTYSASNISNYLSGSGSLTVLIGGTVSNQPSSKLLTNVIPGIRQIGDQLHYQVDEQGCRLVLYHIDGGARYDVVLPTSEGVLNLKSIVPTQGLYVATIEGRGKIKAKTLILR